MSPVLIFFLIIIFAVIILILLNLSRLFSNSSVKNIWVSDPPVDIINFAFLPHLIKIAPGETVTWTNRSDANHTVTSNEGLFESGVLAPGATFSHTFTNTGVFPYHCSIHSSMRGQIVVS